MILVLAGTRDGREIASALEKSGYSVTVSVTSEYGRELAKQSAARVQAEAMTEAELALFIRQEGIRVLVDATHPYAVNVSRNAAAAAKSAGIPCLRYERPCSNLPDYAGISMAPDMQSAAEMAVQLGETVFLTVGSHTLPIFRAAAKGRKCRLIARVLPQPDVIAACLAAGFSPADIVALQGPFSCELNMALFREYGADVMVTKNSGAVGGMDEKMKAAIAMKMKVVVVQRPALVQEQIFSSVSELTEHMKRSFGR